MKNRNGWRFALLVLATTLMACGQAGPGSPGEPDDPSDPDGPKPPPGGNDPAPLHDTIAYVPNGGDEIRLIAPDGTNDRALWQHGQDDAEDIYEIYGLTWNPQATRLAFSSNHENWCSIFSTDVFVIGADASDYGRTTQAPACDEQAEFPQATVNVPVENVSFDSFAGFMYFQGASTAQIVALPSRGNGMVTFPQVADFGSGEDYLQVASLIVAEDREILFGTATDVPAGGTVTTPEVPISYPSVIWEARSPSWDVNGRDVSLIYNFNSFVALPFDPAPLAFGEGLIPEDATMPDFTNHLERGPTADTADDFLFAGTEIFNRAGVYRMSEGDTEPGEPLVAFDSTEVVLGLAWLPDASGFLYSVTETDAEFNHSSNMFLYDLATGDVTRLTSYSGDYVGELSVSGDGTKVAFEFADSMDDFWQYIVDPDVHVLDLATLEANLLVESARSPAWSW